MAAGGLRGLGCEEVVMKTRYYIYQCDKWMDGRNMFTQGLWGVSHVNPGLRRFFCDGSFVREEGGMGFAVWESVDNGINFCFAGWNSSCSNALNAELFAILQALLSLSRLKVTEAVLFSDSLGAVHRGDSLQGMAGQWVERCFSLLEANNGWCLEHILREENETADKLLENKGGNGRHKMQFH